MKKIFLRFGLFIALGVRLALLMLCIYVLVTDATSPAPTCGLVIALLLDILLVVATDDKHVFAALTSPPGRRGRLILALSHAVVLLFVSLLFLVVAKSWALLGFHAIFILVWVSAWFSLTAGFLFFKKMSVFADICLMMLVEVAFLIVNARLVFPHV